MFNLSKPQTAIYEMDRFLGGSVCNIAGAILFEQDYETIVLEKTVNILIKSTDTLRTRIVMQGSIPMQTINEYTEQSIPSACFSSDDEYEAWANENARIGIDLFSSLYEFTVIKTPAKSGIYVKLHHIIGDAWTLSILANQINSILSGDETATYSYTDYLTKEQAYINSDKYAKDKEYWLSVYDKNNEVNYLSEKVTKGYESDRFNVTLSEEQTNKIKNYCKKSDLSEFMLFATAVAAYCYRITDKNNFYIGTPVINRAGTVDKNTVGTFINTIPVAVNIGEEDTFAELANKLTTEMASNFRHQKFIYSDILTALRKEKNQSEVLFDVIVSYQNAKIFGNNDVAFITEWYYQGLQTESLQVHIDDRDDKGLFTVNYDYQTEKFSKTEIESMHGHLMNLIHSATDCEEKKLYELSVLSVEELHTLLYTFNDTAVVYSRDKTVHQLFEEQVEKSPDKMAVVACDKTLTYRELNEQANRIAHGLIEQGVKPGDIVAFTLTRKSYLIAAMLGILKAGAAYLPIDPQYPKERIEHMLVDSSAVLCVSEETINKFFAHQHTENPCILMSSASICYCIYTSGSTGQPKGTLITHRNVVNFCNNNVVNCIIQPWHESIVSVTTVGFDIFVTESILPLLNGMRIYLSDENQASIQSELNKLVVENNIDVIQTTPTKMQLLIYDSEQLQYLKTLKVIVLGGEKLEKPLIEQLVKHTDARIYNIYGPTETTVWSTNTEIRKTDITIGKPIANTQIYILNKYQDHMPIGAIGELCIAGDGVGKGYLNRPELTAEKFVDNPFGKGKMYKTGDLAKWRADGNIEFIGRNDFQVKIRGLRIELGEIETVLSSYESIKQAVVALQKDENQRQYICAFYLTDSDVDLKAVRAFMGEKLPLYMIPHIFTRLDALPMTSSGKINRKALPDIDLVNIASTMEYTAPITEQQKKICKIMEEVLKASPIGLTENFFEIGGDSLKAIEFVSKAHNAGIYFSLQAVFDNPTVEEMCEFIENGDKNTNAYNVSDFEKYEPILSENVVDENFIPLKTDVGDILITGATGFLGAHVLSEYVDSEQGKVYCLVRGSDINDSGQRLRSVLKYYFKDKYDDVFGTKIIPICGDITKEKLADGEIPTVAMVIHTAATVKHFGSYKHFYEINVLGTQNVIKYAKSNGAKLIHISTMSVSGDGLFDQFGFKEADEELHFFENCLYIGQPLDNVYIRSKFEAECVVLDAVLEGLEANIVRVGNLTNRYSDAKFQSNFSENAFVKRVKAIIEIGILPDYLDSIVVDMLPIEYCAKAIKTIAQHFNMKRNVFHVHHKTSLNNIVESFMSIGVDVHFAKETDFVEKIKLMAKNDDLKHAYEALINDMDENMRLSYVVNIFVHNTLSTKYLNRLDFEWPPITVEYIKRYVEYFRSTGYLEACNEK